MSALLAQGSGDPYARNLPSTTATRMAAQPGRRAFGGAARLPTASEPLLRK